MSEHVHVTLNFLLGRGLPPSLKKVMSALNAGQQPDKADLATLPEAVRPFLSRAVSEQVPDYGLLGFRFAPLGEDGDNAIYRFHYERYFHDDEYYNLGVLFLNWIFQFAAADGHLGVEIAQWENLPTIYSKRGGDIVVSILTDDAAFHATLIESDPQKSQPEPPVLIVSDQRAIAPLAEQAAKWTLDDLYE